MLRRELSLIGVLLLSSCASVRTHMNASPLEHVTLSASVRASGVFFRRYDPFTNVVSDSEFEVPDNKVFILTDIQLRLVGREPPGEYKSYRLDFHNPLYINAVYHVGAIVSPDGSLAIDRSILGGLVVGPKVRFKLTRLDGSSRMPSGTLIGYLAPLDSQPSAAPTSDAPKDLRPVIAPAPAPPVVEDAASRAP